MDKFQAGDVVRVVGQNLNWAVLYFLPPLDIGAHKLTEPRYVVWNDVHGRQEFPPEALELVSLSASPEVQP